MLPGTLEKTNVEPSDLAGAGVSFGPSPARPFDARDLVAQLGAEVAAALSVAAERVTSLATTGRISRASLRALREEIDRARRLVLMAEQVSRLASGRVPVTQERQDLTALLHEAVRQRAREIQARGVELRQQLAPAEVRSDATLLFGLLQAVLNWSFEHASSVIDIRLEVPGWPARARLHVAFGVRPPDEVVTAALALEGGPDESLDTLSWHLLQQTASVLGLDLWRRDGRGRTELTLDFPDTLAPSLDALGEHYGAAPAVNSQPLAGRHVLALASRREVRSLVRQALRPMGLMLDFVATVDEARQLCSGSLPHAVIYEAALGGEEFERLRGELRGEAPQLGFIRIVEQGKAFEVLNLGGRPVTSVGRDAIIESLPAALQFELARAE
jgi:hypothetical protein